MKIVVKYRPDIALDAAISDFIRMAKAICDNYSSYDDKCGKLLKSSLTNLKRNKKYILDILKDESSPLSKMGPKGVALIKDTLLTHVGTDNDYYCYRPLLLVQHILALMLVSNNIKDENLIKLNGLRRQYLRCGNMAEALCEGHGKEVLVSLLKHDKNSTYWKRVEWFLEATD